MIWKFMLELCLAAVMLFLAGGFWATAKSPAHLKALLADPAELRRIYQLIGIDRLHEEAAEIEPVVGSYAGNIEMWNRAHAGSLSQTRNLLGMGAIIVLSVSWFLGLGYCLATLAAFTITALSDIPSSAKNNNVTHLHTVMLNLIKWSAVDSPGCSKYCTETSPELEHLYETVQARN